MSTTQAWVGLNTANGLGWASRGIFAGPANPDGTFSIPNVPPGSYQLVVWDENLDFIFGSYGVTVNGGVPGQYTCNTLSSCNLGNVPVFNWFGRQMHFVYFDQNQNGFREANETAGISNDTINLRWRDGTVYQTAPTDGDGYAEFAEVFPFFAWQVAEVDMKRFKSTGVTVVTDDGGAIPHMSGPYDWTFDGSLNPQPQVCTAYRCR